MHIGMRKGASAMVEPRRTGGWAADELRRAVGRKLEAQGWGPRRTPSAVIHQAPELCLRAYGGTGPAVLLVPAPIKRAYIWDLAPAHSVVACLRDAGCRVYLLEWLDPRDDAQGLEDYADRLLGSCVEAVAADGARAPPVLAGHSLGGTLVAIFAALHPARTQGLILAGAPLYFDPCAHVLVALALAQVRAQGPGGGIAGAELTALTVAAAPFSVGSMAWFDRFLSLADPEDRDILKRVERWTLDELAMSAALADDIVRKLYRENALARGTLVIGGRPVDPRRLSAPVLAITDPRCALAPPAAVEPFLQATASTDVERLRYEGDVGVLLQHAGLLVGRSAHRQLWPRAAQWVRAHARGAIGGR